MNVGHYRAGQARSAGLTFRTSCGPINKAALQTILHNRIYMGEFDWDGARYKGTHVPIVSVELRETVSQHARPPFLIPVSRGLEKTRFFFELIRCADCGCALVEEIKKSRYIYYRCTCNEQSCDQKYVKEETLEPEFVEVVGHIALPVDFVDRAVSVIQEGEEGEQRFHLEAAGRLEGQLARIDKRLDAMYEDRLDGRISPEMHDRRSDSLKGEQARLQSSIRQQRSSTPRSYADASAKSSNSLQKRGDCSNCSLRAKSGSCIKGPV